MKIFPESEYAIKLNIDGASSISELKKRTLSKEQFVVNWNDQTFIGNIKENEFELKLSKKLFGEFCVLNGNFEEGEARFKIQTSKIVKIIFSAMVLSSLSGIIFAIIENKLELIFKIVLAILALRFFVLELGFRMASRSLLNKFTEIIGIQK